MIYTHNQNTKKALKKRPKQTLELKNKGIEKTHKWFNSRLLSKEIKNKQM